VELLISIHDLSGIVATKTLKLVSYIKYIKVIVLINSSSTHNFIHCPVSKETHCYVHVVDNFQIMIANGDMMKYGRKFENVKLQMEDYFLKSSMFIIEMGYYDIVLTEKWL
jgi:hypothetical protein